MTDAETERYKRLIPELAELAGVDTEMMLDVEGEEFDPLYNAEHFHTLLCAMANQASLATTKTPKTVYWQGGSVQRGTWIESFVVCAMEWVEKQK